MKINVVVSGIEFSAAVDQETAISRWLVEQQAKFNASKEKDSSANDTEEDMVAGEKEEVVVEGKVAFQEFYY